MPKQILSNLPLKTIYLDNRKGEKVQFLEIPKEIDRTMLVNEVEGCGKHFESSLQYVDKENKSRMVLISAETQELGLMAVTYIAGALGETCIDSDSDMDYIGIDGEATFDDKKKYYEDECVEPFGYDFPEETWIEKQGRIPVICAADVACYYSSNYIGVDFGMTLRTGQNERNDATPYWTKCCKEAVCIILDEYMGKSEIDILNKFATNKEFMLYLQGNKMIV